MFQSDMFLNFHTVGVSNSSHYARDTSDKNPEVDEPDSRVSKRRRLDHPDRPVSEPEQYQYNLIEPQQAAFSPAVSRLDDLEGSSQVQSPGEQSHPTVFGHKVVSAPNRAVPGPFQRPRPLRSPQALCLEANHSEITATFTPSVTTTPPLETW